MGTTIRWVILALCAVFASGRVWAATSSSGGYGAELSLNANVQVIGLGVGAAVLAATPNVQSAGSSSYGPLQQSVLGVQVGLLGTRVLDAGVLYGETEYQSTAPLTRSRGGAEDVTVNLQITPLLPLLGLGADSIEARARVTGVCGALQASGEALLANARVTALGGGVLQLQALPAPNSFVNLSALGILGVTLTLNEQQITSTANGMAIEVNALHLDVSANALLASLVGDIVIGHARAERTCAAGDGPNLRGSKTAAPAPGIVGQPLVFTLSAANQGNQNAPNVVLSDTLHPSFQYQSVQAANGGQCQHSAPTVTCTWPSVAAGASVSAQVTVIPTQAGTWPNTLNVGFEGPDGDPGDDDPTIQVEVQPAPVIADAGITLQAVPNPALTGLPVTLLVTGYNTGPDGTALSINHTLSGDVTISSITPSGSGNCTGSLSLQCGWALLPAGSEETITIVLVPLTPGTIGSSATLTLPPGVTDPDPIDNSAQLQIPVQTPTTTADLSVVKTAAPVPGRVGQPLVYTLSVSNVGPDATGARVTDVLDNGLQLQSAVASDGGSCSGAPEVVCTWASIPAGATRTATLTTLPTRAGLVRNTAVVGSTTGAGDPDPLDDSSTIEVPVDPAQGTADLGLQMAANPDPATVGQPLVYTLTLRNAGPDVADVRISDALPAALALQTANASDGGSCASGSPVVCSWSDVPSGAIRTATLTVLANQAGTVVNTAVAASTDGSIDPNPADNTASRSVVVQEAQTQTTADLGLQMAANPDPATVGQPLVYTLTLRNAGPDVADVRISDALPAALALQTANASDGGSCASGSPVVCSWSDVPSGAIRTATLTVLANQAGTVVNTAVAASTDGSIDPNPADNTASRSVVVQEAQTQTTADLGLQMTANPDPATVGESLVYTLTLRNAGPDTTNAQISDALPATLTLQSAIASDGGSCGSGSPVVCSWSHVPSGTSRTATVTVRPTQAGTVVNTAVAASTNGSIDPNPADNTASRSVVVQNAEIPPVVADVATTVRAVPGSVTLGQTLSLQIEARNAGPDAANVRIDQVLDPGFALLDSGGANCTAAPSLQCTFVNVNSGGVAQLTLTVRANRTGSVGHVATAQVLAPASDPDLSDNTGNAEVQVLPPTVPAIADLWVRKEAFPVDPVVGAPVDYVLTLSNAGPEAAAGPIVLTDEMPAQMRILSATAQGETPCSVEGQTVRCEVAGLAAGASLSASVLAVADVVGPINNRVRITHPNTDPNPANNEADTWVQVRARDGLAVDGTQCRITDRLTAHGDAGFVNVAGLQYGGSTVIHADRESAAHGTFVRSLLRDARKQRLSGLPALADARLLAAAQSSEWVVVQSGTDLVGDAAGGGLFLVDVGRGDRHRLDLQAQTTPWLVLDGGGDFAYALTATASGSQLVEIEVADRSRRTIASFPQAVTSFRALEVSSTGAQLALVGSIDPLGSNADGSVELFRLDVATTQWQQLTNEAATDLTLGGFDGAGQRVVWQNAGHLHVQSVAEGARQVTTVAGTRLTPRLTHNGTQVLHLAARGSVAGSLELVRLDVAAGTETVLTRFGQPGIGADRLLAHDGSGRTLLLASQRALLGESGLVGEHLYRVDCDHIRSGAWYNPARSGQGYAISRSQDGLAVLWYTYRADGTPTWYIASGPAEGRSWKADLLDVRYNAADGTRTLTPVGTLALSFADSHQAIAHWTVDGITRFEPIQFLGFDADPPARDDTGIWFEPASPGWGLSISHQDRTRFVLAYIYDTAGRPIWVEGQEGQGDTTIAARSYFGPGLCATTCGDTGPAPLQRPAGQFALQFPATAELWVMADYRSAGDPGVVWQRNPCRFAPLVPLTP